MDGVLGCWYELSNGTTGVLWEDRTSVTSRSSALMLHDHRGTHQIDRANMEEGVRVKVAALMAHSREQGGAGTAGAGGGPHKTLAYWMKNDKYGFYLLSDHTIQVTRRGERVCEWNESSVSSSFSFPTSHFHPTPSPQVNYREARTTVIINTEMDYLSVIDLSKNCMQNEVRLSRSRANSVLAAKARVLAGYVIKGILTELKEGVASDR